LPQILLDGFGDQSRDVTVFVVARCWARSHRFFGSFIEVLIVTGWSWRSV
jgi:hypothetical protein